MLNMLIHNAFSHLDSHWGLLVISSVKVKGFGFATLKLEGTSGLLSEANYFENHQNLRASVLRMHVMCL